MSKYDLPELWSRWQQERVTTDMAVGHLIQNMLALEARVLRLQRRVQQLEAKRRDDKPGEQGEDSGETDQD